MGLCVCCARAKERAARSFMACEREQRAQLDYDPKSGRGHVIDFEISSRPGPNAICGANCDASPRQKLYVPRESIAHVS